MTPIGVVEMDKSTRELAEFVRTKRRERRLTQIELALLADVGRRFVTELESGEKSSLRLDKIEAVLAVFGKRMGVVSLEREA